LDREKVGFLGLAVLLLAELSGYLVNRLLHISLYYDMGPLDSSAGVPEEGGVRRPLVTHDSMELAAHPLPAPRSLLLESE